MLESLLHATESWLYRRGFAAAPVRRLMAVQMLVSAAALLTGAFFAFWSLWPLAFGIGSAISACGFWFSSQAAHKTVPFALTRQRAVRFFLGLGLRLLLTGAVLFVLIVKLRIPLIPLVVGLTFTVICIVVWNVLGIVRKQS